jgi:hypothetical protein
VPVQDNLTRRLVQLEGAFGRVFERAMDWAEEDFRKEIEAPKWTWPNKTMRANGSEADTVRDIVDLGGLRDSQKREDFGQERTVFVWTGGGKEYALYVHDGYTAKGGRRMPARPFTDNAISEIPSIVDGLLIKEVRSNG